MYIEQRVTAYLATWGLVSMKGNASSLLHNRPKATSIMFVVKGLQRNDPDVDFIQIVLADETSDQDLVDALQ